jgi:hypothetical protein
LHVFSDMPQREIPREAWRAELDQFSREHEGCLTRVEVISADGRARTAADDLPLQGVSADSPANDGVAVVVGDKPDDHFTHEIADTVSIAMEEAESGDDKGVRIRSAAGTTVHVECRKHRSLPLG